MMKAVYKSLLYREFVIMKRSHTERAALMVMFIALVLVPVIILGGNSFSDDMEGMVMFPLFTPMFSAYMTEINRSLWKSDNDSGFTMYFRAIPPTAEEKASARMMHRLILVVAYAVPVIVSWLFVKAVFGASTLAASLSLYFFFLSYQSISWWSSQAVMLKWQKAKKIMTAAEVVWVVMLCIILTKKLNHLMHLSMDDAAEIITPLPQLIGSVPAVFALGFMILTAVSYYIEYQVTIRLFDRKETGYYDTLPFAYVP